jgi:hypothetical protein
MVAPQGDSISELRFIFHGRLGAVNAKIGKLFTLFRRLGTLESGE